MLSHQRLITLDTLCGCRACNAKAACPTANMHWLPLPLPDDDVVGEDADVLVELAVEDVGDDVFESDAANEITGGPGKTYTTGVSNMVGS